MKFLKRHSIVRVDLRWSAVYFHSPWFLYYGSVIIFWLTCENWLRTMDGMTALGLVKGWQRRLFVRREPLRRI